MITNIIEIELLPADRVVTRPVHQWDIGQIIKVTDAEIEDGTPVDFGNRFMKGGLRAYVIDNQVTIPAPALQQERDLTGYVVITDENSETTVKEIAIPVIARPKPEDYVDEEIRESTEFQYVISAVEAVEANAKAAAEAAGKAADSEMEAGSAAMAAGNAAAAAAGSANNAAGSATEAAASKEAASNAAGTATSKATEAGNSAAAAASSASAAKASETNAATSAGTATSKATAAEASATAAANSATAASGSANAAKTSETNASTSATNAANSASAAKTSETNANTAASTATSKATAAANSAKAAADSEAAAKAAQEAAEAAKNEAQGIVGGDYATKEYVQQNGGKIQSVSVDGKSLPIDANKDVNIDLSGKANKATTLAGYGITDGATKAEVSGLQKDIDNQQALINDKQPKGNYLTAVPDGYVTDEELQAEVEAREQAIADLNARVGQQTFIIAQGETQADAEAWLESNADKTKVYLMPDETFWQYRKVTEVVENDGVAYTNLLPTAVDTDGKTIYGGDYNGDGVNDGYKTKTRLSGSSGSPSSSDTDMCASGFFLSVKEGDIVRIKGTKPVESVSAYVITYNSSNARVNNQQLTQSNQNSSDGSWYWVANASVPWFTFKDDILTVTLSSEYFGTGFDRFRFSGHMDENTIVTVNEEIKESSGTTTTIVEKWATTGHGLISTDYDALIAEILKMLNAHTEEINALREMVESGQIGTDVDPLDLIRNWDAPIYDANIPVFSLDTEKTAKTNATNTPDAIYSMYDALMAKYPKYITKTDLGVCSDGVNHVYRYDFREPEPYHQSNMPWSETKTKAILVSGIHYEWAGIYSLYYALEEITENPKLFDLRRNTHFIVIPVLNPYCTITANYNASIGVLNANGVQIHRNFEVGFIYPDESGYVEFGERNHGGTAPLSEMETQCLDNIFKANTDAAFFLTCHNFDSPSATNGLGFIWPSSATKYMCNMGYRLIDKMTKLWLDKYGDELEAGIADYRTDNVSDDFIRFGHAHISLTDGTETRQATKYGIQGNNVEVCVRFYPHGTKANVEPSLSAFTLSRGAETYINFLLTACGVYDYKDKKEYFKG